MQSTCLKENLHKLALSYINVNTNFEMKMISI